MASLNVLFCMVCLLFFGSCHQDDLPENVAAAVNGGSCLSNIGRIQGSNNNCNRLLNGLINGANVEKWQASDVTRNQYMTLAFNKSYAIGLKYLEIFHAYDVSERKIKTFQIEVSGDTHTFNLTNREAGGGEKDTFNFTMNYQTKQIKLTVKDLYNESGITAMQELRVYAVPITPTHSMTSPLTLPTTWTSNIDETSTKLATTQTSISTTTTTTTSTTSTTTESTTSITQSLSTSQPTIPSTSLITTAETTTTETSKSTASRYNTNAQPSTLSMQNTSISPAKVGHQGKEGSGLGLIIGPVIAFLVIIAIALVVVFFVMRRQNRQKLDHQDENQSGYVNFAMDKIERVPEDEPNIKNQLTVVEPPKEDNLSDSSPETSPESSVQDLKLVDCEPESANTQPLHVYSNAIKLDDLALSVDNMLQNPETFQDEFKSIPAGKQHPTTFADRSTLHVKNRFRNIKPYDHSRVSLIQKESDDSMYINANFISAYNQPKYCIAAQGPNKDSVDDFWRMIWEHRVPVIVMVTNCKEAGKDKCTKYWPDQGDDKQTYDDVDVVFDKNSIMADYKIRDFKISKRGEIRAVRQYHYTSWPDEGVPTSCSALISFVNRIREYTDDKDPPNVVHCSAGVGRTGTFITVNYSIDMAREESIVNIKKVVHRLREDRINMVQTLSQYKFLYALMLECLYCGEVTIPCQGASEKIQHLFIQADGKYSQAEKQWKVLDVLKPKNWEDECLAGRHKDNIEKNRTQTILPHDNHRPYLRRRPDYTSNYINAVFVDGYKKKNKFLLTQHPLENTVVDLWRTVSDFNISTIVMLNSCSDDAEVYWPEDEYSEALQYGDFLEVTFKRVDKQDEFTITEVQMFEDKEKANVVSHIQVKNWSEDSKPKLSILPALYNIVTQAQMADEDSRIMIHNLNGDGNTGVYCALHQIFDKIKEEQEIDIFNAVKNTRMSRPDAIPDMDTYRYLHDASVQFIEQFSTYANFQ